MTGEVMNINSLKDLVTSLKLKPKWPEGTYDAFTDGTDTTVRFDMVGCHNIITGPHDVDILTGNIKFTQEPYAKIKAEYGIHSGRVLQMWLKKNEDTHGGMSLTFLLETADPWEHDAYLEVTMYPYPILYSYACGDTDVEKRCKERLKLMGEWDGSE